MSTNDPFAGWTMASVGCRWSRQLPDGTLVHLSSWTNGHMPSDPGYKSGYRLTHKRQTVGDYATLDEAMAGYEQLGRYYGSLFTGADSLMGPSNDPPDLGESVHLR